jgi:hypothetical protein
MTDRYRQEVFNVLLAQLLQERGVITAPETIIKLGPEQARRMPDVIVNFQGLRTTIEGEVNDQPDAQTRALDSASKRVTEGIAHIGVAVVYPAELRGVAFEQLKSAVAECRLLIAIVTESGESGYAQGNVDYLESALRHAFEQLAREDIVTRAATLLSAGIERFASACAPKRGIVGRMALALGIRQLEHEDTPLEKDRKKREVAERERAAISRIGGLVILNAMIFQEVLSEDDNCVLRLEKICPKPRFKRIHMMDEFDQHWKFIFENINYYPIFHVGREVLGAIPSNPYVFDAIEVLAETARTIVQMRAPLRHDLMGRVYHRLLADAKYLGTYYTGIPAAALLLKLALRPDGWATQWHDPKQVGQLRIADLACGTGTLLMAAADAITDNHISASAKEGRAIDFNVLQEVLAEDVLYGYDVLPFLKMNLFSLPLGGPELRLGSIEFLIGRQCQMAMDLFGAMPATQHVTGEDVKEVAVAQLPDLDLCVMNPPFTRSVGGNLLFGSVPEAERDLMQEKLKELVKKPRNGRTLASITAGLGSVFVAAADRYIKPGGRIALVLPKALLSGVAWDRTRSLLRQNYRLEYLVASHDPQRWNFSESTDLSEVLLVAKKNGGNNSQRNGNVVALNLWRNLATVFESLAVANQVAEAQPPDVETGQGALGISLGRQKVGEAVSIAWKELKEASSWLLPCAFAQSDLTRVAAHLSQGSLWLPGHGKAGKISLCALSELGSLGPDRRDIHDGFSRSLKVTPYPAFWGHDAEAVCTMAQQPNAHLMPLHKAKEGRNLRKVEDLWPLAGSLVLVERMRLNTQKLTAARLTEPVLSNTWWPFTPKKRHSSAQRQKALVLWLNSTLGVLLFCVHREETQGSWVGFKKPVLSAMPVLDLKSLCGNQLKLISSVYDRLCDKALRPLPEMDTDDVRAEIDKALAKALKLPDFSILRQMLAREPVVCLRPL